MLTSNRIIFSDNGTLTDYSATLNDFYTGTVAPTYTASQDYLYVGGDAPFNHRYFDVSVANAVASTVSVEIWDGSDWNAAVDVIDETTTSGASLAQSGRIQFAVD